MTKIYVKEVIMMNESKKHYLTISLYLYLIIADFLYVYKCMDFGSGIKFSPPTDFMTIVKNLFSALLSSVGPALVAATIFNTWAWRWKWVRTICRIDVPYIGGRWEGHLQSSYTNFSKDHPIALEIKQNLQNINIWYYDENAVSHSILSDIIIAKNGGPARIICIYENQPIKLNEEGFKMHSGVMDLYVFKNDSTENIIKGKYFNNPNERQTYGQLEVLFKTKKLHNSFS